jgi:transposase
MTETELYEERKSAIHLQRSGVPVVEVAQELGRSTSWVYKWWDRYKREGGAGLHSRSRAPHHCPTRMPELICQSICQARSELEAEAEEKEGLRYIGAGAVQARLRKKGIDPPPSTASIERTLRHAGMTRSRQDPAEDQVIYPRLRPTEPGQLCQVDIVPYFLKGGDSVACFNGIDVVSCYPMGQAYEHRRSQDAMGFLIHLWQTIGIP